MFVLIQSGGSKSPEVHTVNWCIIFDGKLGISFRGPKTYCCHSHKSTFLSSNKFLQQNNEVQVMESISQVPYSIPCNNGKAVQLKVY